MRDILFRIAAVCTGWLAIAAMASAQSSASFSAGAVPPRPVGHVADNAGLFTRDPQALRKMESQLQQLDTAENFKIYIVIESVVMGSNPIELAARFEQAWIPDGNGFVVVYEADSRTVGIGRPYDVASALDSHGGPQIPSFAASDLIDRVRIQIDREQHEKPIEGSAFPARLATLLADECGHYLAVSHQSGKNSHLAQLGTIVVGIILLLLLLGLVIARLTGRREALRSRSFRFPPVPDQQRLGAPFGAQVSSRRFGRS